MSLLNWVAAARHTAQSERVQWAGILTAAAFLVATLFVLLVAQPTIQVIDGPTYHKIALRLVEELPIRPNWVSVSPLPNLPRSYLCVGRRLSHGISSARADVCVGGGS